MLLSASLNISLVLHTSASFDSLILALLRSCFLRRTTNQRQQSPTGAIGGGERGYRENPAVSTGDVRGDAEHVEEQVLGAEIAGLELCVCVEEVKEVIGLEQDKEVIAGQRLSRLV